MTNMALNRHKANSAQVRRPPTPVVPPKPIFVQRSADTLVAERNGDLAGLLAEAQASPGLPLDATTRSFMEPRFGHDFSGVRVHADPSSALAARALDARAFTVGDHIHFAAGHYAPRGGAGQRMIAHELAHVVQQRSGLVAGQPGPDGIAVNEPSDRFEQAAETVADAVVSHRAGAAPAMGPVAPARGPRGGSGATIQRFLAGEAPVAHGGIEEAALQEAGFSKDETRSAYVGNWLRDYSQILDAGSSDAGVKLELVKLLFTGQFGRAPLDSEIGRYLPSEHVDNPGGSDSAENPDKTIKPEVQARHIAALSPEQRAFYNDEQTADFRHKIDRAAEASGLPKYIEVAKEHVRRQITEAATLGRTDRGREALGNGLHAVEDYFAHSNFVEVALAHIKGKVGENNPKVRAMQDYYEVDPTNIGTDPKHRPQIVTGTSAPGASEKVGRWEEFKTELRTFEVQKILLRGAMIRYGHDLPMAAGRKLPNLIGGAVGGVVGGVAGVFTGAAHGAAAGWRGAKHWYEKPFAAIGGLFGGAVKGAGQGAVAGAKTGARVGGKVDAALGSPLGRVGELAGGLVGFGLGVAAAGVVLALIGLLALGTQPAKAPIERKAKRRMNELTHDTVSEAKKKNIPLPTHSQIAKDDPDHPLHGLADRLAHVAVREIGRQMIKVWETNGPAHETALKEAIGMVDFYMAHPLPADPKKAHGDPWWQAELLSAVKDKPN
jgi:hypothetical protein